MIFACTPTVSEISAVMCRWLKVEGKARRGSESKPEPEPSGVFYSVE